jgi:hypothetical protein
MNKAGHLAVAFILCIIFIYITNLSLGWFDLHSIKYIFLYSIIICLFCLLPDIDSKSGTITWVFIGLSIMGMTIGFITNTNILTYSSLALLIFTYVAAEYMPHRGFIHSILFGIIVAGPVYYLFSYPEAALAFLAFYSHLAADGEFFKII